MKPTYLINNEHNGVEIYFDSMPSNQVRELLKNNGWRWLKPKKCWYNKRTEATIQFVKNLCETDKSESTIKPSQQKKEPLPKAATKEEPARPIQVNEWVEEIRNRIRNNDPFNEVKAIHSKGLQLMDHQKAGAIIAERYHKFAFFYDTGTGKTAMTLNIIAEKYNTEKARFLIVAPKPLIKNAWLDDAEKYFPDMRILPLSANITLDDYKHYYSNWTSTEPKDPVWDRLYLNTQKIELSKDGLLRRAQHFIINIDQNRSKEKAEELLVRTGVNGLIIDESSILKNFDSKSSQRMRAISEEMDYVYLLSGKPAPNSPLEYFPQMKIVDPDTFNMGFDAFKDKYFMEKGRFKHVLKNQYSERDVTRMVGQRSIIVRKEECLDLPNTTAIERKVDLDEKTYHLYSKVLQNFVTEVVSMDGQRASTKQMGKLARIAKLREIASGFFLDENDQLHVSSEKNDDLIGLLEDEIGSEEQVIIWCNFQYEIETIERVLRDRNHTVVTAYGKTKNVDESIQSFRNGQVQYMIANPRSIKYGVTFTNCHYAVYNSLSFSFEDYYQYRKGQDKKCFFYHLLSRDTIDEYIYKNLDEKHMTAKVFEDLVKKSSRFGVDKVLLERARKVDFRTIDKAISAINAE